MVWISAVFGILGGIVLGAILCAPWLRRARGSRTSETRELRAKVQSGEIERTKLESQAARVAPLETDLNQARARLEVLSGERSALQAIADRVPVLERRVASLTSELTDLKSLNAALQTQLREQAQAHEDKV